MQTHNDTVIEALLALTEQATSTAEKFRKLPEGDLNFKTDPARWSILECIEHLNRYGEFYLPEIQKAILKNKSAGLSPIYRSGLLGNYFVNLMKVKNGKIAKMKSPADKNPVGSHLTAITIDRFLKQQEMLKALLLQARQADLTNTKVPISITRFIRLRLGDTLRFYVYHIERHIFQAENIRRELNRHSSAS